MPTAGRIWDNVYYFLGTSLCFRTIITKLKSSLAGIRKNKSLCAAERSSGNVVYDDVVYSTM